MKNKLTYGLFSAALLLAACGTTEETPEDSMVDEDVIEEPAEEPGEELDTTDDAEASDVSIKLCTLHLMGINLLHPHS